MVKVFYEEVLCSINEKLKKKNIFFKVKIRNLYAFYFLYVNKKNFEIWINKLITL